MIPANILHMSKMSTNYSINFDRRFKDRFHEKRYDTKVSGQTSEFKIFNK